MGTIGPYIIQRQLGAGTFGTVYRCVHEHLGDEVAVKVINDRDKLDAIITEAKHARSLEHPNIVRFIALDHSHEPAYAVFEFVDGEDLSERLAREGRLPWREVVRIICDVLAALDYAHGRGVIHRDIKPSNILLGRDGAVKLSDFGLGHAAQMRSMQMSRESGRFERDRSVVMSRGEQPASDQPSPRGSTGGTILYMAPQQLRGEAPDPRDDLYSVGVTLYETLTGSVPQGRFAPASEVASDAPEALDAVIDAVLAPAREGRPASVEDMREALLDLIVATVVCPECGAKRREDAADQFTCPECGRVHLCLSHRDEETGLCEVCVRRERDDRHLAAEQQKRQQQGDQARALLKRARACRTTEARLELLEQAHELAPESVEIASLIRETKRNRDTQRADEANRKMQQGGANAASGAEPTMQPRGEIVFVAKTAGRKYHGVSDCSGLAQARGIKELSLVSAKRARYTACALCGSGNGSVKPSPTVSKREAGRLQWRVLWPVPLIIIVVVVYLLSRPPAADMYLPTTPPNEQDGIAQMKDASAPESPREQPGTHAGQEIIGPSGIPLVWVPGGSFMMGSEDGGSDEKPIHRVELSGFWIGKTEVTVARWRSVMGDVPSGQEGEDHAVVHVSWSDCQEFCRKAGLELPTEAQWEYAARSPEVLHYPWGDTWYEDRLCWDENRGPGGRTFPVGSFPSGASWCGALDMSGNVWEWCADWYDGAYYASSTTAVPPGASGGTSRVLRGGSWCHSAAECRTTGRFHGSPGYAGTTIGFRVVSSSG